jgi:hypothetical protein
MKRFLTTCIVLMFAAGIYGASDMTRDLSNDKLINYENVRERHAKSLLFVIKTTGIGTYKFRPYQKKEMKPIETKTRNMRQPEAKEKQVIDFLEEFSRGDCGLC